MSIVIRLPEIQRSAEDFRAVPVSQLDSSKSPPTAFLRAVCVPWVLRFKHLRAPRLFTILKDSLLYSITVKVEAGEAVVHVEEPDSAEPKAELLRVPGEEMATVIATWGRNVLLEELDLYDAKEESAMGEFKRRIMYEGYDADLGAEIYAADGAIHTPLCPVPAALVPIDPGQTA